VARVHAHPRSMGPKNGLPSLRYFGLPPAQPLRLAPVDPTDRYLRAWKPVPSCLQFDQQRMLSRFFSLLPPSFLPPLLLPLPAAPFSTIMAKRKATAEELEARAESNGYKRGRTERKTALETMGSTIRRLRGIKIRCWTATCLSAREPDVRVAHRSLFNAKGVHESLMYIFTEVWVKSIRHANMVNLVM
jgi:hypothetical protein